MPVNRLGPPSYCRKSVRSEIVVIVSPYYGVSYPPVGCSDQLHRSHINFMSWHCKYRVSHFQIFINNFVLRVSRFSVIASHFSFQNFVRFVTNLIENATCICSSWMYEYEMNKSLYVWANEPLKFQLNPIAVSCMDGCLSPQAAPAWNPDDWDLAPPPWHQTIIRTIVRNK